MKRVFVLTVACLSAVLLTVPAQAQNLWVRGPVTAMGAETLTVTVKGVEHVFKIDPATTQVIARGGTTAMKEAEKGKPSPKLGDFVKVGTNVELHYKEAGGTRRWPPRSMSSREAKKRNRPSLRQPLVRPSWAPSCR